jgi:hypothetical protein
MHEQGEQAQFPQCDDVYIRPTHFVDVYADMKHDELYQDF